MLFVFHSSELLLIERYFIHSAVVIVLWAPLGNAESKNKNPMSPLAGSRFSWNLRVVSPWCGYWAIFGEVGAVWDTLTVPENICGLHLHLPPCQTRLSYLYFMLCITRKLHSFSQLRVDMLKWMYIVCVCASQNSTEGVTLQELFALVVLDTASYRDSHMKTVHTFQEPRKGGKRLTH